MIMWSFPVMVPGNQDKGTGIHANLMSPLAAVIRDIIVGQAPLAAGTGEKSLFWIRIGICGIVVISARVRLPIHPVSS